MEWERVSDDYAELVVNNKRIGVLNKYDDHGESQGFVFDYRYGWRYFEGDEEYFENVSLDEACELCLKKVKEDLSKDVTELELIIHSIDNK